MSTSFPPRPYPLSAENLRCPPEYNGKKTTAADMAAIRSAYRAGIAQKTLASAYGITQAGVSYIVNAKPRRTAEQRFWAFVEKDGDCWLWGGATAQGYGSFHFDGHMHAAHLISWLLAGGRYPEGPEVFLHDCDIRRCVNPNHLSLGTSGDNLQDSYNKGRRRSRIGLPRAYHFPEVTIRNGD